MLYCFHGYSLITTQNILIFNHTIIILQNSTPYIIIKGCSALLLKM